MKPFNKKWLKRISPEPAPRKGINRRTFLVRGGVALGSGALLGLLPFSCVREATTGGEEEISRNPTCRRNTGGRSAPTAPSGAASSPSSRTASGSARSRITNRPSTSGAHCAKGAAARDHGFGHRRVKVPDEARERRLEAPLLGSGHQ